jgi:ketosteroid isomerase-like protein
MRSDVMSLMLLPKTKSIDIVTSIDMHSARHIAIHWITAWNTQSVDRLLSIYHDDVVFNSPGAIAMSFNRDGVLSGKLQLRNYFTSLLRAPKNAERLSLIDVMVGTGGYALYYGSSSGQFVTSFAQINGDHKVIWVSEFLGAREEIQLMHGATLSL